MHENAPETTNVKRYAPSQRNRVLNRRKSGDRSERNYSCGNDGDKNQVASSRNTPIVHGEAGINTPTENPHPSLIPIDGCCSSEAAQLLNEHWKYTHPTVEPWSLSWDTRFKSLFFKGWAAAMRSYNDSSVDLSERPVMYSGASGSAWGHSKLPPQMDFLAELRRAMRNSGNVSPAPNVSDHT